MSIARRLTPHTCTCIVAGLMLTGSTVARAQPAPESTDAPATAPTTDAPASKPTTDAPASKPTTDAPATAPTSSKAPPSTVPTTPNDAGSVPAPEVTGDPTAEDGQDATSRDAGKGMSGEVESESIGGADTERVGKEEKKEKNLSHYQTGSIAVGGGWGFYGLVPYTDGMYCGEFSTDPDSDSRRKSFCTNTRGVGFLEFTAGYGAHPRLDLVLGFRLTLNKRDWKCQDDTDPESCQGLFVDKLAFGLFPGIRGWISKPEELFKVGAALDFMWMREDFSGYRDRPVCTSTQNADVICPQPPEAAKVPEEQDIKDNEVGVRLGPVFQIDPHHNVGIYIMPTARMGFLRWFEFAVDVQLGVQARFP